ncbi:MAG: hypothetical protein HOH33_12105 [Verrucomicrobia bacterium]|jgi:hypothetical protein|nr:hypothetical protein [Verrucomicrobiota bacterium]
MMSRLKIVLPALMVALWSSEQIQACATCFGQSDSKLADGMSWGILTLVAVAYSVLIGIVAFFGYLIYRSNRMAAQLEVVNASEADLNP